MYSLNFYFTFSISQDAIRHGEDVAAVLLQKHGGLLASDPKLSELKKVCWSREMNVLDSLNQQQKSDNRLTCMLILLSRDTQMPLHVVVTFKNMPLIIFFALVTGPDACFGERKKINAQIDSAKLISKHPREKRPSVHFGISDSFFVLKSGRAFETCTQAPINHKPISPSLWNHISAAQPYGWKFFSFCSPQGPNSTE